MMCNGPRTTAGDGTVLPDTFTRRGRLFLLLDAFAAAESAEVAMGV